MVVGGDGIVHEVVNGLLEKSHKNVGIDLVDGILPEKFTVLPLNVPIGIIPAGISLKFILQIIFPFRKHFHMYMSDQVTILYQPNQKSCWTYMFKF